MRNKIRLLLPAAALVMAAAAGAVYYGDLGTEKSAKPAVQTVTPGGSLVIPTKDLSQKVSFFPIEVDGTKMEVLAVKDASGRVRTAFNTCQVCYGSGRGVYSQQGDVLVCANCGNRFSIEQIEVEAGGCNPFPIFPENKTETAESVSISYDFLKMAKTLFARWSKNV